MNKSRYSTSPSSAVAKLGAEKVGAQTFSRKSEKQTQKKNTQRRKSAGGFIKNDWELLGLCLICIKIVLKGGYGGPPRKFLQNLVHN